MHSIETRHSQPSGRHSLELNGVYISKATASKGSLGPSVSRKNTLKAKRKAAASKAGQFIIDSGNKKVGTGKPSKYKF